MIKKAILFTLLATFILMGSVYADSSTLSGTLSATMDEDNGTVTAMFVGYSGGNPVIIGPTTWESSADDFSDASAEDIGKIFCGSKHDLKKITKSTHTGRELVAEVVISSQNASILVGR